MLKGARKHLVILLVPIGLGLLAITAQVAFADSTMQSAISHSAWYKNVSITYSGSDMTIVSDGLPSWKADKYAKPNQGVVVPLSASDVTLDLSSNLVYAQKISYAITLNPVKAAAPTTTSLGVIGILVNGAVLYNPYEGDGRSVAVAGNVYLTDSNGVKWGFLDVCNGHPGMGGMYHYHGMPPCVTSVIDTVGGPSHILGVAFDGFPIYGNKDINGKIISSTQLDDCNGITSPTPEFPAGLYHYVLTEEKSSRSTINCYAGTPNPALITKAGGPPPGGGLPGGPGSMPGMGAAPGIPTVDPVQAAATKAAADKVAADAKALADKTAADLKTLQDAADKAAADAKTAAEKLIADAKVTADKIIADAQAAVELKAKQELEAKAVAELKAKQEADTKAAADKLIADAKAQAEQIVAAAKAAVDKATADKAVADKAIADKAATDKAAATKTAAAAKKLITITCVKGKTIKKVTALKPVCPKGYKKK